MLKYKYTYIIHIYYTHSGGSDCEAVNLGCEGYKITCTYIDKQIHYVVAPALKSEAIDGDGMGVDGWNELSMDSFLDMKSWSPFMHDKVQLFVQDVVQKGLELEFAGHKVLRRQSEHIQPNEHGVNVKHTIGHVMVAVGGKVWDFVGEISDVTTALTEGFDKFEESECGKASQLTGYNINDLHTLSKKHTSTLLSIHSAASSLENKGIVQVASLLKAMTGATVEIDKDAESCDVMSVHYFDKWEELTGGATGDKVYMKYVVNHNYQNFKNTDLTVKDYEDYIFKVHDRYLSKPEDGDITHRWRNWDHWLDMHIGVKYAGKSMTSWVTDANDDDDTVTYDDDELLQESCLLAGKQLNEYLIDEHIDAGKRFIQSDGDHYYCGFDGSSMTIEFNTECHYGNEGATDVCTCNVMNSDNLAMEKYDASVSSCVTIYEEQDGHDDTTVTRDSSPSGETGGDKPNN